MRPLKVVSVHVLGQPAKGIGQNDGRLTLLGWVIERVRQACWGAVDAMILPAGFVHAEAALGGLTFARRKATLAHIPVACQLQREADRWAEASGGVLVVGADTRPYMRGFRGDQLLLAFNSDGIVGIARKVLASPIDTRRGPQRSYLSFEHDADDDGRLIRLPSGEAAVLCPCYDAFAFSRADGSSDGRRQYVACDATASHLATSAERADLRARLLANVARAQASVALIGIHGFDQPGRDTRWQRHGVACSSAALGGGLAVAAAHFRFWLPDSDDFDHSTLASNGVARRHLREGVRRCARRMRAAGSLHVSVPGTSRLAATVRLFEA